MRINVYAEELLNDVEWIKKDVDDECQDCYGSGVEPQNHGQGNIEYLGCTMCEATGRVNHRTFYGVRMYLASPPELHDSPEDDDRSAITFWIPWTRKDGHNFEVVRDIFGGLIRNLDQALNNMENSQ